MADFELIEQTYLSGVIYYAQSGLWRHVQSQVKQGLKKLGNDPVMHFWNAFSLIPEGRSAEAMRELKRLGDNRDVTLAVKLALMHAHKQASPVDKEAVKTLEGEVKAAIKDSGEVALQQGAMVMWMIGKHDKGRDLVDKMLKLNKESKDGLALRGWIDLTSGREVHEKKALKYFDESLKSFEGNSKSSHLDSLMGKCAYYQTITHDYAQALELINTAVVLFPSYLPALVVKAQVLLSMHDWDGAQEVVSRCFSLDPDAVEAHHLQVLLTLAKTGDYETAAGQLGQLIAALDKSEPTNHKLFYKLCRAPARLGGRHTLVLQQTRTMLDRAMKASPESADYLNEQALQLFRRDHIREAGKLYKKAMSVEETSVTALTGLILCQILVGQLDDAEQQLDFLQEVQTSIGKTAELVYLRALMASKRMKPTHAIIELVDEAVQLHQAVMAADPGVPAEHFRALQPDFVMDLAKLYLQYCPSEPPAEGDTPNPILAKVCALLETLTKAVPGCVEAVFLLARAKYLSGLTTAAQSGVQYCLAMNQNYADAHLLMAQVQLQQGNVTSAAQSLSTGLSSNFDVREAPLYHVINASILAAEGKQADSTKALQTAMALPGVKRAVQSVHGAKKKSRKTVPVGDRVSVYLALAKAYRTMGKTEEATKTMTEAKMEFEGTAEEVRVTIADADMLVQDGRVESALTALRAVTPDMPYYIQANEKMASIFLRYRKDKAQYINCYKQLEQAYPSVHSTTLLGDAYMNIQEPEQAIAAYEEAMKKDPRNSALASKIGHAMVRTHDYTKAINYYETAVKSGGQASLRRDLAHLHLKLKQPDRAAKVLLAALDHEDSSDLVIMMQDVGFLQMQARMHADMFEPAAAVASLKTAKDLQARVLSRVGAEQPESLKEQQQVAAAICSSMAEYFEAQSNTDQALSCYKEALTHDEGNSEAMLALADVYIKKGDYEGAQYQLSTILHQNTLSHPDVKTKAATKMADIMYRKHEYDTATYHLQQLLDREPTAYEGLASMIDLLRRAGKLDVAVKQLEAAEKASDRGDADPGLNYCQGLYERWMHRPNQALKRFNKARKDAVWGVRALYQMVEICLNPEHQTVGGEAMQTQPDSEAMSMGVKTAEKLLAELAGLGEASKLRYRLQKNYAVMATRDKADLDRALQAFTAMATEERDNIAVTLGLARAYLLTKNTPKARNQLKRVVKEDWTSEDAESFEGAWLLLSDIYISNGKYDLAQELLKKALQHNKSCSKAWEYTGLIMEKEQSYANAAEFYENAWEFSGKSDPAIGFKLGFNYLKAKRFVDAVDICHQVLKVDPKYPKIKKEVLDRARQGLRM
eukprot:TRINITY_DN9437_c0_g2_i5.p1 TRINITY_DN9437_c0_g2~~TRINITY_DN9437_c0_g2_i5.p1  ORF type:complete len:1329 (+),score=492.54 TRINITY_DN9437_c0_g2_i5:125-4111(+)